MNSETFQTMGVLGFVKIWKKYWRRDSTWCHRKPSDSHQIDGVNNNNNNDDDNLSEWYKKKLDRMTIYCFFLGRWSLLIFHIVNSFLHVRGGDLHYIILYFSFAFSCIYVGPFRTHTHTYTHTQRFRYEGVVNSEGGIYTHAHNRTMKNFRIKLRNIYRIYPPRQLSHNISNQ